LIAYAGYPLLLIPLIVKTLGSSQHFTLFVKISSWSFLFERTLFVMFKREYYHTFGL
jgi:hypothetical protein